MTSRAPILRNVLELGLVITALALLDGFLARTDRVTSENRAITAYRLGSQMLDRGEAGAAVEQLRKAWILARKNAQYELQLGNALAALGRVAEAEPLINEALSRLPDDGDANLSSARLMVREGKSTEASSYYHRAIYGKWHENGAAKRISARLEFIALLAEEKRHPEMLAELISLEQEAGTSVAERRKLAQYFMLAGSPPRAANVYRELIARDPDDHESYIGLGEAELASGNYREARTAFVRSALHSPDAVIQSRLQLLDALTSLDPAPRHLTSLEKYRRSARILDLARSDLEEQLAANPSKESPETDDILKKAKAALAGKEPAHVSNEMSEGLLSLAERLWHVRTALFGSDVPPEGEPLRLLLEKLAH